MILYISDDNKLVNDPNFLLPVTSLDFKRGDKTTIKLKFLSGTTPLSGVAGRLISFGCKPAGVYDTDYTVYADTYTIDTDYFYTFNPNFNTVALDTLLNKDSLSTNDIPSVTLISEFTWSDDDGTSWNSSQTYNAVVANDVIRGTEGSPVANQTMLQWLETYSPSPLVLSAAPINGPSLSGAQQVETLTVPANRIAAGNVNASTSEGTMTASISAGADNSIVAETIRTALDNNSLFNDYTVTRNLSVVTVTKNFAAANDSSLIISWLSSIYDAVTSVDTVSGVAPITATAGKLGQDAIVNTLSCYKCTQETPVKWVLLN